MMRSLLAWFSRYFSGSIATDTVDCSCGHHSLRTFKLAVPVRGKTVIFDILGPMPVGHLPYERSLGMPPAAVRPRLCADCLAEEVRADPSVLISYRFKASVASYHDLLAIAEWTRANARSAESSALKASPASDACGCEGCPA